MVSKSLDDLFKEGIRYFKSGEYKQSKKIFTQLVKTDNHNHKAWNALGVTYTKLEQYKEANTCFKNALILAPGTAAYERNLEKNLVKLNAENKAEKTSKSHHLKQPKIQSDENDYQKNWILIPLFFVPLAGFIINPLLGFLALLGCAWYVKRDADSINAGENSQGSAWGRLKGWEWGVILFFLWFLLLAYIWKRRQIYHENIRGKSHKEELEDSHQWVWSSVKILGSALLGIFIFSLLVGIFYGPSTPGPQVTYQPGVQPTITIYPSITPTPTIAPTLIATVFPSPQVTTIPVSIPVTTQPTPTEIISGAPLKIHFIDVGQGDSILLQSGGKNMLIDAGPKDSGSSVISYLKSQGVSSLDVVVATHPHEDHIGGMVSVLDSFPVGLYVDNGETHTTSTYENLMKTLVAKQIPYAEVKAGKTIPFAPGINILVMSPSSLSGDLNQDSVILKVTDGNEKILLPGDSSNIQGNMQAQILKVPHHGSKSGTSSQYLNQVKPEVAVISVGAGNDYGHPASSTLTALQNAGAKVYRTDIDGTVIIISDGSTYSVKTSKTSSALPITTISTPIPVYNTPTVSVPVKSVQPIQTALSTPITTKGPPIPIYSTPIVTSTVKPVQSVQTTAATAICECSSNTYNCPNFPLPGGVTAQQCFDYCNSQGRGDIHGLDRDKDGRACE